MQRKTGDEAKQLLSYCSVEPYANSTNFCAQKFAAPLRRLFPWMHTLLSEESVWGTVRFQGPWHHTVPPFSGALSESHTRSG